MARKSIKKIIVVALICLLMFSVISSAVFAAEPHEDPEIAKVIFSGISLLGYYSDSLDFVLRKEPVEGEARLEKMPFASIPQNLEEATDSFAVSGISISYQVANIDKKMDKLRMLVGQFRPEEAMELAVQISDNLSRANNELKRLEQAIEITGEVLKVSSAPAGSDLRGSYDGVVERINRIKETLDLYQNLLAKLTLAVELFTLTDITLEIQPSVVFVGDNINFEGVLTAEKKPLVGREVAILLNDSPYLTVKTDADGHYQGVLPVPYWYISELDLQALYYPQDKDVGFYLASRLVVKLKVLFYEAGLEVTGEDKAYLGLETTVSGRFNYGQSPPLNERRVEIYFDDVFITEFVAQEEFTQEIKIDAAVDVGKHIVTLSAVGVGRYSPVDASAILNVTRATPILDLNIPWLIVTPAGFGLKGKLSSEVGSLNEALVEVGLGGGSRVETVSSGEGSFDMWLGVGMAFGLIGWQDLVIKVTPQEPGIAPLIFTTRVLIVNPVNLSIFSALLVFLGIYLPRRLRRRRGEFPRRRARPALATATPEPAPVFSHNVPVSALTEEREWDFGEPGSRIIYWYRLVVRRLLSIARVLLRPQQTLREFAYEQSRVLGPAARYFVELTRIVERLLYSQYRPTEADVENGRQLSLMIEEEAKPKVATLPVGGEERQDQFAPVSKAGPWQQLSTWRWVLLIVAVAYYACLLLFLIPLLAG